MDRIELKFVLPDVFAMRNELQSDVWHKELTFERGQLCLVEAASGTGKSSLCSYIFGHRDDYQGMILFDGQNIRNLGVQDWVALRQKHLSQMFQDLRLFPELTAMENVQIKNNLTGFKSKKDILCWFECLGIADKADESVGKLSFGQQQRVALMRALVQPFDFIMVDEPISHLDDENAVAVGDVLMEEAQRQGAGVIVTSIGKHMKLNYEKILHL